MNEAAPRRLRPRGRLDLRLRADAVLPQLDHLFRSLVQPRGERGNLPVDFNDPIRQQAQHQRFTECIESIGECFDSLLECIDSLRDGIDSIVECLESIRKCIDSFPECIGAFGKCIAVENFIRDGLTARS